MNFKKILVCSYILISTQLFSHEAPTANNQGPKDFTYVAKKTIPGVVSIRVQSAKTKAGLGLQDSPFGDSFSFFNDDFLEKFLGIPQSNLDELRNQPIIGQGSGFIISPEGHIITNNHVVKDTSTITVVLNDGSEHTAKVIGSDPNTDIAVIKIEAKDLPHLEFGDSEKKEVGQWVVAIGNPFGLQASLTVGVISAIGRSNLDLAHVEDFIQTDAAINRGIPAVPYLI